MGVLALRRTGADAAAPPPIRLIGRTLPPDAAVRDCHSPPGEVDPGPAWKTERVDGGGHVGALRAPREAAEEACDFLAWLREVGEIGSIAAPRIDVLYAEFCEADGRTPLNVQAVKVALAKLPGLTRRRVGWATKDGRRHRPCEWVIEAAAPPQRRRKRAA